ncbi:hypothetical protein STRDD11_01563 [Streptococcus sp. DD11]|uniref:type II toxin-antitoxin system PemK/MazF family toxin n=1 Tax=Streptococcus sp. DD11 TaxID=1777879 RepID=UPI0007948F83|nr:type II toxin-antitoxin system PemK/MazF family toxin [Streptococcus sp. DD11]KXT83324.1 hypothetical protein STRDD11_01563 [Streptococcus sp. DD11]
MADFNRYDILVGRVEYADGSGAKNRPAMVIRFDDEIIKVLRITSQYEGKSAAIQQQYFEITDWFKAGLKKPSWIDTVRYYELNKAQIKFTIIGKLSQRDIERFKIFIRERLEQ